ncbi:LysR family transcriptional regulator [Nonomuraea sp. NPDC050691]|uniref:LysR family transcriptional regulator n=1 Tax=Nonomuraea sp. NPDC050691 TaxID=3155661 RepID=UPI0033FCB1CF
MTANSDLSGETLELRHFRYFVAVAEYGGFTRAAARLHVSQPTLSQQVRELERRVGTALLIRDPAGLRLTPAGEVFYERVREVLRAVDEAARAARDVAGLGNGALRVAFSLPLPEEIHITVLSAFTAAYPQVRVSWRQVGLIDFDAPLINGEVDAAVMFMPLDPERLVWEPLITELRGIAVPAGHALWDAPAVGFADVLDETMAPTHPDVPGRVVRWWHMDEQRNGERPRLAGEPGGTPEELMLTIRMSRVVCPGPYNIRHIPMPAGLRMIELTGLPPALVVAARRRDDEDGLAAAFCRLAARTVRQLAPRSSAPKAVDLPA